VNNCISIGHSGSHDIAIANISTDELEAWMGPYAEKGVASIRKTVEDANLMSACKQKWCKS
jgi:hypothetical protein